MLQPVRSVAADCEANEHARRVGDALGVRRVAPPCSDDIVAPMPSRLHEALLLLFRNRPELAPELMRDVLHVELPEYREVRIESTDLGEVEPSEFRADLIVLLVDGKPVLAIIVEVQLSEKKRKRFTWPVYVAGARARFECPAVVLVVTSSEKVARWAARPIALGPGASLTPLVIGPKGVPVVTDSEEAASDPELAVLSVLAHGRGEPELAARIGLAAARASRGLDEERGLLYSSLIRSALSEAARKAFQMLPEGMQFFDDEMQKSYEKGRAASKAAAVIDVLEARGLAVSDAQRERILGCADLDMLTRFIRLAATVATTDELFIDDASTPA
jgi:hypothetical protein